MEDRNHVLAWTKPNNAPRKSVYRFVREQLHLDKGKIWRSKFAYLSLTNTGVVSGLSTICITIAWTKPNNGIYTPSKTVYRLVREQYI